MTGREIVIIGKVPEQSERTVCWAVGQFGLTEWVAEVEP